MKNQKGFMAISLALVVLVMILSFMGSAGVYFGNLYNEIGRQQRSIAAHAVTEDLARVVLRSREAFIAGGGTCPTDTQLDSIYGICWPLPGASGTNHCVPHPVGRFDPAFPRLICRQGAGFTDPSAMAAPVELVFYLKEPADKSLYAYLYEQAFGLKDKFEIGLNIVAANLQNSVLAQNASDVAYLPVVSGATVSTRFNTAIDCSAAPLADYCKRCSGGAVPALLDHCVRLRVCLRPDGNCTNDAQWVVRMIGLLGRD